jgi:hypothetical protein
MLSTFRTIPRTPLEYLHAGLMLASAAFLITGVVIFWGAASFERYITGLLLVAVALACLEGSRELKRIQGGADRQAPAEHATSESPNPEETNDGTEREER